MSMNAAKLLHCRDARPACFLAHVPLASPASSPRTTALLLCGLANSRKKLLRSTGTLPSAETEGDFVVIRQQEIAFTLGLPQLFTGPCTARGKSTPPRTRQTCHKASKLGSSRSPSELVPDKPRTKRRGLSMTDRRREILLLFLSPAPFS